MAKVTCRADVSIAQLMSEIESPDKQLKGLAENIHGEEFKIRRSVRKWEEE